MEQESRLAYLNSARYYNSYIKAKRLKFIGALSERLCNFKNPRDFYSALSYYRPKNNSNVPKEYVTPAQFQSFYADQFSCKISQSNHESVDLHITNEKLDKDFDFLELNTSIQSLSKKKAAGPDTIINEIWINLSVPQRLLLLNCINNCWREIKLPKHMPKTAYIPNDQ
jgi:hypothetical protein